MKKREIIERLQHIEHFLEDDYGFTPYRVQAVEYQNTAYWDTIRHGEKPPYNLPDGATVSVHLAMEAQAWGAELSEEEREAKRKAWGVILRPRVTAWA